MIDWTRVNILRDEIGEADFEEVIQMFLEEVEEVLDRLRQSAVESELENDLHFLKSSALNLGFSALSDICGEGEKNAVRQNFAIINLPDVFHTYQHSKAAFLAREKNVVNLHSTPLEKKACG